MTYTDEQIQELTAFADAVIEAYRATDPRQLYARDNRQAYQQYFAEVYADLSGMRNNPRAFFESDLAMRRAWGDQIATDLERYKAAELKEAEGMMVEPDAIAALRKELEALRAEIAALRAETRKEEAAETAEEASEPEGEKPAEA